MLGGDDGDLLAAARVVLCVILQRVAFDVEPEVVEDLWVDG